MTPGRPDTQDADTGTGTPQRPGPSVHAAVEWRLRTRSVPLDAPVVMGILNLTPDSFSDGGSVASLDHALEQAREMADQGAGIIDVGGESTRPGATPVPTDEELRRVLPFVEAAAASLSVPISVDTRNAAVARACVRAGAEIVNDVSGLAHDPDMAGVVQESGAGVVLMHMRGDPTTMRDQARYGDVRREVAAELAEALDRARAAGIRDDAAVLDPGIGFAKTGAQSVALLGDLSQLLALGRPVLVGPSRKSFLGELLNVPAAERLHGTVAACVVAYLQGARIFCVHDVKPVVQALSVAHAIASGRP